MKKFNLSHDMFSKAEFELYKDDDFKVTTFTYPSGIEAMNVENSRGHLTLLPFHGLIIWDAIFDDVSLKMKDMFKQPLPGPGIAILMGVSSSLQGYWLTGHQGQRIIISCMVNSLPVKWIIPTSPWQMVK